MNAHVDVKQYGANGKLPLKMGFKGAYLGFDVIGGPFDKYKPYFAADVGVCVRAERVPDTADIRLAIEDFSVPKDVAEVDRALLETLAALIAGKRVWVGCLGGWGRTGLFLALLAKVCGVVDPIGYVRANYTPRAVETAAQEKYVNEFDVSHLRYALFWQAWRGRVANLLSWVS